MTYFEEARNIFNLNQAKIVHTDRYAAIVCGFRYIVDDSKDTTQLIVAIIKNKTHLPNGLKYALQGDVYVTHKNNDLGYQFIDLCDFEEYNLIKEINHV